MRARWHVWSTARSEKSARHVASRVLRLLGQPTIDPVVFAPYSKTGGWTFSFEVRLSGATWNDCVVDVIALGQRVGYGWRLSGDVTERLEGWSNEARIAGVTSIQWQLWPEEQYDDAPGGGDAGA
jgi:hypothetical protein